MQTELLEKEVVVLDSSTSQDLVKTNPASGIGIK